MVGPPTDINLQKRAKETLHRQTEVLEQSFDGIVVSDLRGNLQFVNRALAAMHGYDPDELWGRHLSFFHTEEQMNQEVIPFLKKTKENGQHIG